MILLWVLLLPSRYCRACVRSAENSSYARNVVVKSWKTQMALSFRCLHRVLRLFEPIMSYRDPG